MQRINQIIFSERLFLFKTAEVAVFAGPLKGGGKGVESSRPRLL